MFLFPLPLRLRAEDSPRVASIQEAFVDANGDGIPDHRGEVVRIRSILLSDPASISSRMACIVNVQDASGGAILFTAQRSMLLGRVQRGDEGVASGEPTFYHGNRQLVLRDIGRVATANVPPPRAVRISDLLHNDHPDELVRVASTLQVAPDFLSNRAKP